MTQDQNTVLDEKLLPCPFCNDPMEERRFGIVHVSRDNDCPVRDLAVDVEKWNRRALASLPSTGVKVKAIAAILLGNVNAPEQGIYRIAREIAALTPSVDPAGTGMVEALPLEWVAEHGEAWLGPYRLFQADTPLGKFSYGTDAEGSPYWQSNRNGVFIVRDEATAKRAAEAAWSAAALKEVSKFIALASIAPQGAGGAE